MCVTAASYADSDAHAPDSALLVTVAQKQRGGATTVAGSPM